MDDHREDYIRHSNYTTCAILLRLLADVLLFVVFVGFGLTVNSLAA